MYKNIVTFNFSNFFDYTYFQLRLYLACKIIFYKDALYVTRAIDHKEMRGKKKKKTNKDFLKKKGEAVKSNKSVERLYSVKPRVIIGD